MWQQDSTYYPGKCTGYDAASGKHTIEYEEGTTEVLRLRREGDRANSASANWRLCGKRRSNDGRGREVETKDESHNDRDTHDLFHAQRSWNYTSKYRGVCWDKRSSKWQALIYHTGKRHYLGTFDNEEEAARAYDRAASAHRGDKAVLNFPAEGQQGVDDEKRSKYRGVSWYKRDSKWKAQIRHTGKLHYLGYFDDEEEAARAYDRFASAHRGDKAALNFPPEGEQGMSVGMTSEYRGVSWVKSSSKWKAQIQLTGKKHHLGCFDDEEEAARAFDRAAREHHGDKTIPNFPAEGEEGEGIGRTSRKKRSGKCQAPIRHTGKRRNLGNYGYSFDDDEETARTYDRAAKAHHFSRVAPDFVEEGVDEQRPQELAAAVPIRTHSWSGMYPSVVVALGFRLQASNVSIGLVKGMSVRGGGRSRGGEGGGANLIRGQTSKYGGVSWYKSNSKWRAEIYHTGKGHSLGYFDDEEEAARAYDRAARAHRGDKATLNFPAEGEKGVDNGKRATYRGVSWNKSNSKWRAKIRHTGKTHYLGTFDDEQEAARAYDRAARGHHGDKTTLNFPAEGNDKMHQRCSISGDDGGPCSEGQLAIREDQSGSDSVDVDGLCSEEWRTSGHRWIGARLARCFASGIVTGRVTRWLPAGGRDEDAALWGMEHDDGDVEDELEEWEVVKAIETLRENQEETLRENQEEQDEQVVQEQLGTYGDECKQPIDTATTPVPAYGQLLEVMSEQDSTYYAGKCTGYDAASGKHKIEYEDGSTEVLRLRREGDRADGARAIWRLCARRKTTRRNVARGRRVPKPLEDIHRNDCDYTYAQRRHKQTSEYRGVSWDKSNSKWRAQIQHTGKKHCLGYFDDEEEAARAYDRAARAHRGDKATLNFPAEGEQSVDNRKRSKYRGVSWDKHSSKWRATIGHTGKKHYLGYFDNEKEAARAYDTAARAHGNYGSSGCGGDGDEGDDDDDDNDDADDDDADSGYCPHDTPSRACAASAAISDDHAALQAAEEAGLPAGWRQQVVDRSDQQKRYKEYISPDGKRYRSLREAKQACGRYRTGQGPSSAGSSSDRGNGVMTAEAGEEITWACESILRKRHTAGSKVEYEVGGH
jgi:hypothetical protein